MLKEKKRKEVSLRRDSVALMMPVPVEQIIELLLNLPFEKIEEVIIRLDKGCQDWGVTENLYKYFEKEMAKLPESED